MSSWPWTRASAPGSEDGPPAGPRPPRSAARRGRSRGGVGTSGRRRPRSRGCPGRKRCDQRGLVEPPAGRPGAPEVPADLAPVLRQAMPPALGVEVPLVPELRLLLRVLGMRGLRDVVDDVPPDAHQGAHALRVERRDDADRPGAPVLADQRHAAETQGVHQIDQVLAQRRLLGRPGARRIEEAGGAVAPEVRNDHAVAGAGEPGGHLVPCARIVREPVEQHHDRGIRAAVLLVADLQRVGSDSPDVGALHR